MLEQACGQKQLENYYGGKLTAPDSEADLNEIVNQCLRRGTATVSDSGSVQQKVNRLLFQRIVDAFLATDDSAPQLTYIMITLYYIVFIMLTCRVNRYRPRTVERRVKAISMLPPQGRWPHRRFHWCRQQTHRAATARR
eukprot:COSAG01_NODE_21950_length_878_cov_1.012837_2_plen_138_part_01